MKWCSVGSSTPENTSSMALDPKKIYPTVQDSIPNHSGKKIGISMSPAFENYFEVIYSGVED